MALARDIVANQLGKPLMQRMQEYYNAQPVLPTPIARMAEVAPNPTPVAQAVRPDPHPVPGAPPTRVVNTTPPPSAVRKEVQHYEQAGQYVPDPLRQQLAASKLVGRTSGLGNLIGKGLGLTGVPALAQGAIWSISNPLDRLRGKGLAANQMMEFPLGGRIPVGARAALGLSSDLRGMAQARALEQAAHARMIPFTKDVRQLVQDSGHPVTPRGTLKAGQVNVLPHVPSGRRYLIDNRVAMLQDPETGTLVLGPGMTHGEVVEWLQQHDVKGAPSSYTDWMQHEIYAPEKFVDGTTVPARINTDIDMFESDASTLARMRLLKFLQDAGVLGDVGKAIKQTESLRSKKRP